MHSLYPTQGLCRDGKEGLQLVTSRLKPKADHNLPILQVASLHDLVAQV